METTEIPVLLRFQNECGQAAVFSMIGLVLLFLGVVLLAQVGLLTHHARHSQAVADSSALSGAVTQAATLNRMTRLNDQIVEAFQELETVCAVTIFPNRESARLAIDIYKTKVEWIRATMKQANVSGAHLAQTHAALICSLNSQGEALFEYLGTEDLMNHVVPEAFTRWQTRQIVYQYLDVVAGVVVIIVETDSVPVWLEKHSPCLTAFAAGSRWPGKPGFKADKTLGLLPPWRTAAQAKPYGGHIFHPNPNYRAKLIALNTPYSPFRRRWGNKATHYEH